MKRVEAYTVGLCYASVCAEGDLTGEEAASIYRHTDPSGTRLGWVLSEDPNFRTGQLNGCVCEEDPSRRHWLLEC